MPLEKNALCENTMPHEPHNEWIPNPLWPVDDKAEPTFLKCPGVPLVNPDMPLSTEVADVTDVDIPTIIIPPVRGVTDVQP